MAQQTNFIRRCLLKKKNIFMATKGAVRPDKPMYENLTKAKSLALAEGGVCNACALYRPRSVAVGPSLLFSIVASI